MFTHFIEGDATGHGKSFCRGSHRSENPARSLLGAILIRCLSRQFAGDDIDLLSEISQAVFSEYQGSGTECIGLDAIGACLEVLPVHRADHIRSCEHQIFITSCEVFTTEVCRREV